MKRLRSTGRQSPMRRSLLIAVVSIVVVSGLMWLSFEYGRLQAGFNRIDSAEYQQQLEQRVDELTGEVGDLRQQLAVQQTSRTIDEEAYVEIEGRLLELQQQVADQQKDLAFYRGIMAPESQVEGLQIKELTMHQLSEQGRYRMNLVLMQAVNHSRIVSGEVRVFVEGMSNGETVSLDLAQMSVNTQNTGPLAFSFRYFQDLQRDIKLPDDFVPERVSLEVVPGRSSSRTIRETFEWSTLES